MALAGLALAAAGMARAQTVNLPPPDQDGWIKLFRGNNQADFYARLSGNINQDVAFTNSANATFRSVGDTIQTTGRPTGHLAFKQAFSHYHFKMEMMIPSQTNCGLLLHIRENEEKMGDFPRSVECQGDPNQGMGELWTISKVWVTVKVRSNTDRTYDSTGVEVAHGSNNFDNSRVCHQSRNMYKGHGQWNLVEAVVNGADSISHLVNGVRVMRYTKVRIENDMNKPLNSGRIAVQAEGSTAYYRNIYIKLLPGDPLYAPVYAELNRRNTIRQPAAKKVLFLENGILAVRDAGEGGGRAFDVGGRILPSSMIRGLTAR